MYAQQSELHCHSTHSDNILIDPQISEVLLAVINQLTLSVPKLKHFPALSGSISLLSHPSCQLIEAKLATGEDGNHLAMDSLHFTFPCL